jgi:hypothetical protein
MSSTRAVWKLTFARSLRRGLAILLFLIGALVVPRSAGASSFYGRLHAGPGYLHNDHSFGDSSGFGIATQLDAGVQLIPLLKLHATVIADYSRWAGFDPPGGENDYESSVYGLGVGATAGWAGLSAGVSAGAQLTFFPNLNDPSSSPYGAGIGPFVSGALGYVADVFEQLGVGLHVVARYRSGKDEGDPTGYQLGLVMSVGTSGEPLIGPDF